MIDFETVLLELKANISSSVEPREVLRSKTLRDLASGIRDIEKDKRADYGKAVNDLKRAVEVAVEEREIELEQSTIEPVDVTAPMDENSPIPALLPAEQGTAHPLMREIERISEIFARMGFTTEDSREIDDQYHMFESLNFPAGHPARDDYDTFMTAEVDKNGEPFVAPAHTSTMQNRVMKQYSGNLVENEPIAVVVPDRVFRNEDVDARHEHTYYQVEGVFVDKGVNAGMLIATLQKFLEEYYGKKLAIRINPFYFPFTEPSFEFSLSCPFCEGEGKSCKVCSGEGWIELLGCGMIHPNVLKAADIDPSVYTGFAFGLGIDRLVMMKYGIEDVRHFESGKLDFLRQF